MANAPGDKLVAFGDYDTGKLFARLTMYVKLDGKTARAHNTLPMEHRDVIAIDPDERVIPLSRALGLDR